MKSLALTALLVSVSMDASQASPSTADPVPNQFPDSTTQQRLDRDVPDWLRTWKIPSVSVVQIRDGKVVLSATYGQQSPGVAATRRSVYNIASLTKPVTAEVVLQLVAKQQLTLDEPMYSAWTDPDIASDERRKQLTPPFALSHQSGFANWRRETDNVLRFQQAPGTAFGYSGEGYEYLAHFAQNKLDTPFETLAQRTLLDAPELHDLAYTQRASFNGRVAAPTAADGTPLALALTDTLMASDLAHASADAYATFLLHVMRDDGLGADLARERARIQVSTLQRFCPAARKDACPDAMGFGLGWEVQQFGEQRVLMHTGRDDGTFSLAYLSPTQRSGMVILTNGDNGAKIVMPLLDALSTDAAFVRFLHAQAD